jgi:hypothetical protein
MTSNQIKIDFARQSLNEDTDEAAYPNSLVPSCGTDRFPMIDPAFDTEQTPEKKTGFWRRQFRDSATSGQKKFDWVFGVILPVACIYFDPIIFTKQLDPKPYLGRIAVFSYVLSFAAIMGTMAWLLWGEKLKWVNAPLAGLFAVSSAAAFGIGVCIAPISFLGLVIVIGALGFTPFFCSIVMFRNSVRAFRSAKTSIEPGLLLNSFVLAAVASVVIPYLLNIW